MFQGIDDVKDTGKENDTKSEEPARNDNADPLIQSYLQSSAVKLPAGAQRKQIIRVKRKRTAAQAGVIAVSDKKRTKLTELFSDFSLGKPKAQNTKVYKLVNPASRDFRGMQEFVNGDARKADWLEQRQKDREERREDLRKERLNLNANEIKEEEAPSDDDFDVLNAMVHGDQLVKLDEMNTDDDDEDYVYDYYEEVGYHSQSFDVSCPVFYLVDPEKKNWDVQYDFEDDSYDSQDSNREGYYANDYPEEAYFKDDGGDDGGDGYDYDIST